MKASRAPVFAFVLLVVLLSLSFVPVRSAPLNPNIPRYPANSIGLVDQYMLQSSRLMIQDNRLYSGYTHFAIADISNPDQIKIVDRIYTRYIYDFVIDGQYVYAAMQDLGVYNLDILVNVISEFSSANFQSSGLGVSLAEGRLYAANGLKGVRILDAARPADLTELGLIQAPGNSIGVTALGKTVFIASGYGGVQIYDASDPAKPAALAVVDTPGYAASITIQDDRAYVADGQAGVRILDIREPKKPVELGFFDTSGTAKRILVRDLYAFVADGESGLTILDISNPKAPAQVAYYRTSGSAVDVALKDNLIFLANMPNGITVLSWTPPVSKDGLEQGGTLESTADQVRYIFATGAVLPGMRVTHQPLYPAAVPDGGGNLVKVGPFFSLTGAPVQMNDMRLDRPVKINLTYDSSAVDPRREAALRLYYWQVSTWLPVPDSQVDVQTKTITGTVDSFTLYGVFYDRRF